MPERLIHDVAFMLSQCLLERIDVPGGQKAQVSFEFYVAAKAALEAYEIKRARELVRLRPSQN